VPLYVYEVVLPDGSGGETFEIIQPLSAEPLKKHPETGKPVRRVFGAPNAPRAWTDSQSKSNLSDKSLASKGFTKYVKSGEGTYEKTTGTGPKKIQKKKRG
jgi:hypothetical protein